jgi:hypothetical protein
LFGVLFLFLSLSKGVEEMNPSLRDKLKRWQDLHQEPTPKKKPAQRQPAKKINEKLTDRDLALLMGTGKPRYYRRIGALKQS